MLSSPLRTLPVKATRAGVRYASVTATSPATGSGLTSATTAPVVKATKGKKSFGSFRSGILGFLLGATTAGAAGFAYLLDEYQSASGALLASVEELQSSTAKVREYARRIEGVDREVRELKEHVATVEKVGKVRAELRSLQAMQSSEHLELAAKVRDLERDLTDLVSGRRTVG
ncbi:hypothetical protein BJ684DRAFT_21004 [Piptocephalis cylindrospora]|uniref:Uncharacterized protein n=1 Tax=Piptocephalis cylindrospora TaxID=1907219 RepID=A0A4P9Y129_9FUNG|nr:hypothetical protein BJ684DRAFT_21004 [Piptocephalis cylindrospora]|eukprot:RKP12457.1 hypothetical protein BJ684DRAFT_21004 [Piptocephalis cylindrospora]